VTRSPIGWGGLKSVHYIFGEPGAQRGTTFLGRKVGTPVSRSSRKKRKKKIGGITGSSRSSGSDSTNGGSMERLEGYASKLRENAGYFEKQKKFEGQKRSLRRRKRGKKQKSPSSEIGKGAGLGGSRRPIQTMACRKHTGKKTHSRRVNISCRRRNQERRLNFFTAIE